MTAFSRGIRSALLVGVLALGGVAGCKGGGGSADAGAPTLDTPAVPVANNNPQPVAPQTPEQAPTAAPAPAPMPAPAPAPAPEPTEVAETADADADADATLAWVPPTQNIDGTPLTNLAGYVISYGSTQDTLSHSVLINDPNIDSAVFEDLEPGTYFFAVQALTQSGELSGLSDLLQKVVG